MPEDLRLLHRLALDAATEYVERIRVEDLDAPTPCGPWTLADLLAHMIGQHWGFALAVKDRDAPAAAYESVAFDLPGWQSSVSTLLAAFDGASMDDTAVLVEIRPKPLPVSWVVAAQTLDTAVHTWDIAQALGEWHEPAAAIAAAVAELAATIPDGDRREQPGSAFARALALDGTPWQRTLAHLGRNPG